MMDLMATERKRTIKPEVETVDLGEPSTVDDQGASGQTNMDSPQRSGPAHDQPKYRGYRVLVNHDQHTVGDVIELVPDARTVALVSQGYLELLD